MGEVPDGDFVEGVPPGRFCCHHRCGDGAVREAFFWRGAEGAALADLSADEQWLFAFDRLYDIEDADLVGGPGQHVASGVPLQRSDKSAA